MALVRKSLIVTLHTGLKAGPAHMSSVVAVVRMSSSMDLAGIVEHGSYCGAGSYWELETGGSGSAADVYQGRQQPVSASRLTPRTMAAILRMGSMGEVPPEKRPHA